MFSIGPYFKMTLCLFATYECHGFVLVSEGEWDNYCVRPPEG